MDLNTSLELQLRSLEGYLRQIVEEFDSPPSPEMWIELKEAHLERADFLNRYVTPKVVRLMHGERISVRPANGAEQSHPKKLEFIGIAGMDDDKASGQ